MGSVFCALSFVHGLCFFSFRNFRVVKTGLRFNAWQFQDSLWGQFFALYRFSMVPGPTLALKTCFLLENQPKLLKPTQKVKKKRRNQKYLHVSMPLLFFQIVLGPLRKVRRGSGTTPSPLPRPPETQNSIKKSIFFSSLGPQNTITRSRRVRFSYSRGLKIVKMTTKL